MCEQIIKHDPASEFYTKERCFITELLNNPDEERLSIARARVEKGAVTALHRLNGVDERYVILEGIGRVHFGELGTGEVSSGDIVCIPAGTPQSIANVGDEDLVFLCICTPRFTPESYEELES